jgi:uncharacterized protein (DUF2141 family)
VLSVLTVLQALLVLVSVGGAAAQAQDGLITGQVVDAASGKPVSAAIVTIAGTGIAVAPGRGGAANASVPRILTAADGRFAFQGLPDGSFTITATRSGYGDGASGRRRPGGSPQAVVLNASRRTADVAVRMWKHGAIAGTVLDEAGEPVIAVRVTVLSRSSRFGRAQLADRGSAMTDDRGVFRFSGLEAGDYLVIASPPLLTVKTTVLDDIGRSGRGSGELGLALGNPRSGNVILGDTLVATGPGTAIPPLTSRGRLQVYPPTLSPSALTTDQAAVITLGPGEERTSVDVQLTPVTTVRVAGVTIGPDGPAAALRLQLVPSRGQELPSDVTGAVTFTDAAGAFVFAGVVPGQYALRATQSAGRGGGGNVLFWLDQPIAIAGEDVEGLTVVLSPPLRITAHSQFDGAAPKPTAQAGRFTPMPFILEPADRSTGLLAMAGTLTDDGGFTVAGPTPGRYRIRVSNSPPGWMFKAALLNGVDVSETPFDLTKDISDLLLVYTDRWSGISGTVQGQGADAATVIAFTTDAQAWNDPGASPRRLRSTRATAAGQYGISSLPPGDYYVAAVREDDAADWRDASFLDALARVATRITILEGEHKSIDLQLREVRR